MIRIILCLSCLLFFFPCSGYTTEPNVKEVYTLSYSPGTLFHALVRDRTKAVYRKAGLNARFIELPHNRSLLSANEGAVDGDVGRVPAVEKKYPNLRRVDVKLMDLNGAVYTTNDEITEYKEELLTNYKVGYVLGVQWTRKRMEGKQAVTVRDYDALFDMLLSKRIDLILATEASADHVIESLGQKGGTIRKLKPFIFSAPIYHYLHKNNASIIPQLEKTIQQMQDEQYWDTEE